LIDSIFRCRPDSDAATSLCRWPRGAFANTEAVIPARHILRVVVEAGDVLRQFVAGISGSEVAALAAVAVALCIGPGFALALA